VSDFKAWNFLCMNSKTKDPSIVTRWYDWIYADQANYDLIGLGIEGKHWVDKGNFTYDIPEGIDATQNYRFPGYVLIWNAKFIKTSAQWPEGYTALRAIEADGDNFVMSELAGFNADLSAVEDEVAMVSAIFPETIFTLTAGVIEDTEAGLANAKKQLEAAGYLKVVEEAQRQVKEFLANK
jgi:putative aldouronate transport system substrate-binding protein